jgi:prophage maintenance system killer protein
MPARGSYAIQVERNVPARMRDGTVLRADLYRPRGTGPFPILLMRTPYDKAIAALAGISYIQPFEDGNKRTSRLMANALLLAHGYAPLSYRSLEEKDYRDAILIFYELNSIVALKHIFISQYDFAARNYTVV